MAEHTGKKLLLVEDSPVNAELVQIFIGKRYALDTAASYDEALSLCAANVYDAILMDVGLGTGPTGLDLTRHLRKDQRFATTPILALTAYAMQQDRDAAASAGCSGYLPKPFTRADLLAAIDTLLNKSEVS